MTPFPVKILIQEGLEESAPALRARGAAPGAESLRFRDLPATLANLERLPAEEAKLTLVVARRRGGFVKEFPAGAGVRRSPWHYFIPAIGCPADCRYCFLQSYHAANAPVVFADLAAMLARIETKSRELGGGCFYGGELCDNLMLEGFLGAVGPLMELFRKLPSATLELRTKSAGVEALLAAGPAENATVSWTFSPGPIAEEFEAAAAPVSARIEAARRAQAAGFRVGVRFDPIILGDGWKDEYEGLIGALSAALDGALVESVHLGCLRFTPALKAAVLARFDTSTPFDGEFAAGPDGKLRYPRPVRTAAYAEIAEMVAGWNRAIPLSLCMETPAAQADFRRLAPSARAESAVRR